MCMYNSAKYLQMINNFLMFVLCNIHHQIINLLQKCGELASVPKAPFINRYHGYARISYSGHACPKLNLVRISRLTDKRATTKKLFINRYSRRPISYFGHSCPKLNLVRSLFIV